MSIASANALAYLDEYIAAMKAIGKPVTILRPYAHHHAAVVAARSNRKYVLKHGEDKDFTTYRGYPVEPV